MTDFGTFRRLVRQRMGVPTSDDFFTDAVLNDAINLGIATVEEEHYWPWAERVEQVTVVNGQMGKPDRWRATRGIYTPDGFELRLVALSDFMAWGASVGTPEAWADSGEAIAIAPIPSGPTALVHAYYRSPVDLVDDADEPDLPSSLSGAVIAKAAELLSAREDDTTARGAHQDDYQKWINRMLRSQRRSTGPVKIRVRPGGWI